MTKLILKPPHAVQLMTPAGEVLEPRPDGSYDVSAHPALVSQHPDWEMQKIEEEPEAPAHPAAKPRVLLKAPSPAIHQIFSTADEHVIRNNEGLFDVTNFPRLARQYKSWLVTTN